jgi:hypothetical protein
MNEAGHVIPSLEVEPEQVVSEHVDELLHLVGERGDSTRAMHFM